MKNIVLGVGILLLVVVGLVFVGLFYLDHRVESIKRLHVQKEFSDLKTLPRLANAAGDVLEITSIDPLPPVALESGAAVTIRFRYQLVSSSQACVWARALKDGKDLDASGGSGGSPEYPMGSGTGEYSFYKDGPCDGSAVEIFLSMQETGPFLYAMRKHGRREVDRILRLLTIRFPASFTWKAKP